MKRLGLPTPIAGVFLLSLAYWLYLSLTTSMTIANDSIGYENLGRMLQTQGWIAYFKTGPNREPMYPLLIMLSMHLEAITGIAYTKIMAFFGLLILWSTQILIYFILKKLRVRMVVCVITLAYFAISPALNNAAFSLYSEIVTFPLILLLLLANIKAYQTIQTGRAKDALCAGVYIGLVFGAITFVKGIFEFIFLIFALIYLLALLACFLQRKKSLGLNCLLVLFAFCICYQTPVVAYKFLNKKYNDHYALTNRGSWAFYASCARRAEKLTPERLLTALAYIPGEGFCEDIFGKEKCYFWGYEDKNLNSFGLTKFREVSAHTPPSMVDQKMMALSKEKVMHNPAQFLLLMSFDGLKMFFWESTKIGFVTYPPWLQRLYDNPLLKNGWRAVVSLLSLMGFAFLMIVFFKNLMTFFMFNMNDDTRAIASVSIFILMLSFIGFYALFDTTPRFALPIAPLELITIAFLIDTIFQRKCL